MAEEPDLDQWRLFYNPRRIQRALGRLPPAAIAAACLARPPLRLAPLDCAGVPPGMQGAATIQ